MNPFRDAIKNHFGRDMSSWVPHIAGAPRLRFELGTDVGSHEERYGRALERSLLILQRCFPSEVPVLMEFATFLPVRSNAHKRVRSFLERLGIHPVGGWCVERILFKGGDWDYREDPKSGLWHPPLIQDLVGDPAETHPSFLWRWSARVNPGSTGIRDLLAYFLSRELRVTKRTVLRMMGGRRFSKRDFSPIGVENLAFFDPHTTILVRPYDDRGADLIAGSPEALQGIYDDLKDIVLEWDRDRILEELGRTV